VKKSKVSRMTGMLTTVKLLSYYLDRAIFFLSLKSILKNRKLVKIILSPHYYNNLF